MIAPRPGLAARPYSVPAFDQPIDLRLDGNEGSWPDPALFDALRPDPATLRRYPDARPLEAQIAARFGVDPAQVVVAAGADEILDRLCRAFLAPGRTAVLPTPGFEMLERYARLAGATLAQPRWVRGAFPTEAGDFIAVTSPNNPTGAAVPTAELLAVADRNPEALVLLDGAYVEFADEDPTEAALTRPNVVVVRTLSKAWGLAGLRVGYAVGPRAVIDALRVVGSPYPVGALSLALAAERLRTGEPAMRAFVDRVRTERTQLGAALGRLADVVPSQANFVFAELDDPARLAAVFAARGIAIRTFPGRPGLERAVRIACPGRPEAFARVLAALEAA